MACNHSTLGPKSIRFLRRAPPLTRTFFAPPANILFIVGSSLVMDHRQGDRSKSKCRENVPSKLSNLFGSRSSGEKPSQGVETLSTVIKRLTIASKYERKAAEERRRGMNDLARWAENSGNAAIEDVLSRTKEVTEIYTDRKLFSADKYCSSVDHIKYIVDFDRQIEEKHRECFHLKNQERSLKVKIEKMESGGGFFRNIVGGGKKGGDLFMLRRDLVEIQNQYVECSEEYRKLRSEREVCKMFKLRELLKGMHDADQDFAVESQVIFECLREICEQVPAVSTQDVNRMNYQAKPITKELVDQLKANLSASNAPPTRSHRRRSEPSRRPNPGTPPPPYTPTAPPEVPSQITVSDSYLLRATVVFANDAESSTPSRPPRIHSSPVRSGRMYPPLPPNPYQRTNVVVS
ncbi:hypothetical protein L596_027470 [Steinernema carpocapsae]|uniref:BAR domain-containing protein n=1 Tax=Steinernema carpocapsae TaxID=34508 RepID=A0A4U5LVK6_STECR|nr:hypothetical protein L596_027470 [Steinernema carpocapsae]